MKTQMSSGSWVWDSMRRAVGGEEPLPLGLGALASTLGQREHQHVDRLAQVVALGGARGCCRRPTARLSGAIAVRTLSRIAPGGVVAPVVHDRLHHVAVVAGGDRAGVEEAARRPQSTGRAGGRRGPRARRPRRRAGRTPCPTAAGAASSSAPQQPAGAATDVADAAHAVEVDGLDDHRAGHRRQRLHGGVERGAGIGTVVCSQSKNGLPRARRAADPPSRTAWIAWFQMSQCQSAAMNRTQSRSDSRVARPAAPGSGR